MERTPPLRRIVLAIGLPGSGKSTYFARKGITPLSSDLVRQLLFDDPAEQRLPGAVFGILRHLLTARLAGGARVTYVDATKLAERFGCAVDALYFDVPVEVCLGRNGRRARRVPQAVIRRMARRLQPPTAQEGFRRIFVVASARGKARGGKTRDGVS